MFGPTGSKIQRGQAGETRSRKQANGIKRRQSRNKVKLAGDATCFFLDLAGRTSNGTGICTVG